MCIRDRIMAKAKEYGIPENYAKRCAIKDDEDLDAYFKALKQAFANEMCIRDRNCTSGYTYRALRRVATQM